MPVFLLLTLLLPAGQALAETHTPPTASAAPQKKPEKLNGTAKEKNWEHMNRYKVWDANRKEFVYPENWIAPEKDNVSTPDSTDPKAPPRKKP